MVDSTAPTIAACMSCSPPTRARFSPGGWDAVSAAWYATSRRPERRSRVSAPAPWFSNIKVTYDIDADASPADVRAIVAQSQKRSAVFDLITNPTDVTVEVT